MARRMVTISTDTKFVEAIDNAVSRVRRANPDGYISRSAFIKTAIRRAMNDLDARPEGEVRTRRRVSSPKTVAPVAVA